MLVVFALGLMFLTGLVQSGFAQTGTNPLILFKNYFVTGDYVVGGWVEGPPAESVSQGDDDHYQEHRQPSSECDVQNWNVDALGLTA